jgi:hypothetical protein
MNLERRLEILLFEIDRLESELQKAEIYKDRLLSFKNEEMLRKDYLYENIVFLKTKSMVVLLNEYKIVKSNLKKTIDVIQIYDYDIGRLVESIELQKRKIELVEKERLELITRIEQNKNNILLFRKK